MNLYHVIYIVLGDGSQSYDVYVSASTQANAIAAASSVAPAGTFVLQTCDVLFQNLLVGS